MAVGLGRRSSSQDICRFSPKTSRVSLRAAAQAAYVGLEAISTTEQSLGVWPGSDPARSLDAVVSLFRASGIELVRLPEHRLIPVANIKKLFDGINPRGKPLDHGLRSVIVPKGERFVFSRASMAEILDQIAPERRSAIVLRPEGRASSL